MPTSDYIPEPSIILCGCQPWTARPVVPGYCRVCGPGIREGHDSHYCARCDSLSPRREAQVKSARVGLRSRGAEEAAARQARTELERLRKGTPVLTEIQRRRLWMGYSRSGIDSTNAQVVNRAKVARDWLISIGQAPDWSLILDAKGRVIGRLEPEADVA